MSRDRDLYFFFFNGPIRETFRPARNSFWSPKDNADVIQRRNPNGEPYRFLVRVPDALERVVAPEEQDEGDAFAGARLPVLNDRHPEIKDTQ